MRIDFNCNGKLVETEAEIVPSHMYPGTDALLVRLCPNRELEGHGHRLHCEGGIRPEERSLAVINERLFAVLDVLHVYL